MKFERGDNLSRVVLGNASISSRVLSNQIADGQGSADHLELGPAQDYAASKPRVLWRWLGKRFALDDHILVPDALGVLGLDNPLGLS